MSDRFFEKDILALDRTLSIVDQFNNEDFGFLPIKVNMAEVWTFDDDSTISGEKVLQEPFIRGFMKCEKIALRRKTVSSANDVACSNALFYFLQGTPTVAGRTTTTTVGQLLCRPSVTIAIMRRAVSSFFVTCRAGFMPTPPLSPTLLFYRAHDRMALLILAPLVLKTSSLIMRCVASWRGKNC